MNLFLIFKYIMRWMQELRDEFRFCKSCNEGFTLSKDYIPAYGYLCQDLNRTGTYGRCASKYSAGEIAERLTKGNDPEKPRWFGGRGRKSRANKKYRKNGKSTRRKYRR